MIEMRYSFLFDTSLEGFIAEKLEDSLFCYWEHVVMPNDTVLVSVGLDGYQAIKPYTAGNFIHGRIADLLRIVSEYSPVEGLVEYRSATRKYFFNAPVMKPEEYLPFFLTAYQQTLAYEAMDILLDVAIQKK